MSSDPFAYSRGAGHAGSGSAAPEWQSFPQQHSATPVGFQPQQPASAPAAVSNIGGGGGGARGVGISAGGRGFAPTAAPFAAASNNNSFGGSGAFGGGGDGGLGGAQRGGGADPYASSLASMASLPVAQMGMAYGRDLVRGSLSQYMPGAVTLWHSLRYYFDVNNTYVVRKMGTLCFPFTKRNWARRSHGDATGYGGQQGDSAAAAAASAPASPVHDENAPDMYIPAMAFITYLLVSGLAKGVLGEFHPDVLVTKCSSALLTNFFEVFLLRAALYTFAADVPCPILDLVAFTGYKYVALVTTSLIALTLGRVAYYLALAWTGASTALFFIKSLRVAVHQGGMPGGSSSSPSSVDTVVMAAGALQVALIWWLGA